MPGAASSGFDPCHVRQGSGPVVAFVQAAGPRRRMAEAAGDEAFHLIEGPGHVSRPGRRPGTVSDRTREIIGGCP